MRGRTVRIERHIPINNATLRLDLEPAGNGKVRVVRAYRLLPGAERATRAPKLESTYPVEQLKLDDATLHALNGGA